MILEPKAREFLKKVRESLPMTPPGGFVAKLSSFVRKDSSPLSDETILQGCQIRGYVIDKTLGAGAAGVVFLAHHSEHGEVAVKVLVKPDHNDEVSWALFKREASIGQAIEHPAVLKTLEFCTTDIALFIFMEYAAGTSLGAQLKSGPLPLDRFLQLFPSFAAGLQAAHEEGVVHRDLKPDNVMVSQDSLKILDFGMARWSQDESLTLTNQFKGTINYCSPEQVTESKSVGPESDQFSFGLICFEALTGRLPYPMASKNPLMNLMERLDQDAVRLREIDASFPAQAEEVLARMLEREPQKRFPSVAQAFAALEQSFRE